jgi:hypothetical protein
MDKTGFDTDVGVGVETDGVGTGDTGPGGIVVQPAISTRTAAQPNNRSLFISYLSNGILQCGIIVKTLLIKFF